MQAKMALYLAYIIRFVVLIILFTLGGLSVSIPFSLTIFLAIIGASIGCMGKRISRLGFAFGIMVLMIGGLIKFGVIPDLLGDAIKSGGFNFTQGAILAPKNVTGACTANLMQQLNDIDGLLKSNTVSSDEHAKLRTSVLTHFEKCNEK